MIVFNVVAVVVVVAYFVDDINLLDRDLTVRSVKGRWPISSSRREHSD